MPQKQKVCAEEKMKIVRAYLAGKVGMNEGARRSGVNWSTFSKWIRNYEVDGADAFLSQKVRAYSSELKRQAVEEYLSGAGSLRNICKKYHIRSDQQLQNWIKVYNAHGDFNSKKHSGGGSYMKQGRDTTYAVKNEMISENVADRVDRPKKAKFLANFYSKEELTALFEATADDSMAVVIQLAAYYGLRRSEVLGIRWSAVDFERGTISINHKVVEVTENGSHKVFAEDKLKTKSSFRTLPLIPAICTLLLEQKGKQAEYRKLFKRSYCQEYSDYICVDEMGKLFRPNYITDHFRLLLKRHDLRTIRFHDLRHSCASLLLSQGIPMKQIQDWLGHSTFATTADIYSHLDFNSKQESADAIAVAFAFEEPKEEMAEEEQGFGMTLGIEVSMKYDDLREQYPAVISKDQLYRICHISKRKALWLLEHGVIPCQDSGKQTQRFQIRLEDAIDFLERRDAGELDYVLPCGIFSSGSHRAREPTEYLDSEELRDFLLDTWQEEPDVLTARQAEAVSGYSLTALNRWLQLGLVEGVKFYGKNLFSKESLVEYLASRAGQDIAVKSEVHLDLLEEFQREQKYSDMGFGSMSL